VAYDVKSELSPPLGELSFACWQTGGNFNTFSNKSQEKKRPKKHFLARSLPREMTTVYLTGASNPKFKIILRRLLAQKTRFSFPEPSRNSSERYGSLV
jgi:hypothetical protein